MSSRGDHERLLDDVLSETAPAGFREAMLAHTLRLARRRRHLRQTRRAAVLIVALGCITALLWRSPTRKSLVSSSPASRCAIVHSQPLRPEQIVTTHPLPTEQQVTSIASANVVHTRTGGGKFRLIDDDELLALVGSRPAALIRLGPRSEELVFVNPGDRKGFPID